MNTVKGRVLKLQKKLQTADSAPGFKAVLRGNELYRLLSIINKVKWGYTLNPADEHDLLEIEGLEQGSRRMLYPEKRFFPPAFSRYDQHGVLCWFQDLRQGPLRALRSEEAALWKKVGPTGFHGYIRLDETIQAYTLSGCEESPMPDTYPDVQD